MLDALQVQLEAHFAALANTRRPAGYPVYPIEHGLAQETVREAWAAAAREHRQVGLSRKHWLVWVILAAEAGYGYDGEEYWPSLERVAGEWRPQQDRQTLKGWYGRFHEQLCGPVPEGRWANHFNIIAWPITGAILPRYLQSHFARHLFNARYGLSRLANASAGEIGTYLSATHDERSARYGDFLQQTDLTGRIVLALRDEDLQEAVPRINPTTLARLVADLEARRDAAEFLRAARQVLRSTRGVTGPGLRTPTDARTGQPRAADIIGAPRLVARAGGDETVLIGVQMPDFVKALEQAGLSSATLARVKLRLIGDVDRASPGVALLSWSNLDRPLRAFPAPNTPIIDLEGASSALSGIIRPLAVLEERPVWLLRRELDGAYRQVAGRQVRPGQSYFLLSRSDLPPQITTRLAMRPMTVAAPELKAYGFRSPTSVSANYSAALQSLGLGFSLRARVDPAGLGPVRCADFAGPSWPAGEVVAFRLSADFEANEFILSLDAGPRVRVAASPAPTFVALGPIAVGRHSLSVMAVAATAGGPGMAAGSDPIVVEFHIFEPRPWPEVASERAGFRAVLDPVKASLEALLTGQATVDLYGPPGRRVTWRLETIDASGQVATAAQLGQAGLPMTATAFGAVLKRLRDHSDAIDVAHRVDLIADLEDLGRQALRFPHRVDPLRWVLDPQTGHLRLVDETSHDEVIAITRINLQTPSARHREAAEAFVAGVDVSPPGALVSARYRGQNYIAFASVPPSDRLSAFSELGLAQDFRSGIEDPARAVVEVLRVLRLWQRARPIGRLALLRKPPTIDGLERELRRQACGVDWAALLDDSDAKPGLVETAQQGVGGSPGFASRMRTTAWEPANAGRLRAGFFFYAERYKITRDRSLSDLAIILAFQPHAVRIENQKPEEAIKGLLANRALVRGAFLARASVAARREAVAA